MRNHDGAHGCGRAAGGGRRCPRRVETIDTAVRQSLWSELRDGIDAVTVEDGALVVVSK